MCGTRASQSVVVRRAFAAKSTTARTLGSPSVLVDLLAHFGDIDVPGGTPEKADAEPLLEKRDPAADAGLRNVKCARGRREAAVPHDRGEELEVVEVTHPSHLIGGAPRYQRAIAASMLDQAR